MSKKQKKSYVKPVATNLSENKVPKEIKKDLEQKKKNLLKREKSN